MKNIDVAIALNVSTRTVQNKRNGYTKWTLPQYNRLVEVFGKKAATEIISGKDILAITSDKDVSINDMYKNKKRRKKLCQKNH